MRHGYLKLCNAVYWLALTMWVSALLTAGVAAMNVFGKLSSMPIELTQFRAAPLETHGRLAAGMVMEGVFFTVDIIQFAAGLIVIVALLVQLLFFKMSMRMPAQMLRVVCIFLAGGLLTYHALMIAPVMNRELRAYWSAAEAGNLPQAQQHLARFNVEHPKADQLLKINLILLLIAVAASAAALGPERPVVSALETPRLKQSSRRSP